MIEAIDEEKLVKIVGLVGLLERMANRPQIPISIDLWSKDEIAAYLKLGPRTVRERTTKLPGFPQAIYLPTQSGKGRAHPLWKAKEVIEWAVKHQERRVA